LQLVRDEVRGAQIIAIQEANKISIRCYGPQRDVSCLAGAQMRRTEEPDVAGRGKALHNSHGAVGRSIIHHNDVQVRRIALA
jgi:hypothetical protein